MKHGKLVPLTVLSDQSMIKRKENIAGNTIIVTTGRQAVTATDRVNSMLICIVMQ